jgi:hypothetical protein
MTEPVILPRHWYTFRLECDPTKPGLYEWRIEGAGSYIGKYGRARRPTREYGRNVHRLLNGRPYRLSRPDGFRRIHRELAQAHRDGRRIELIMFENCEPDALDRREMEVIAERGNLNDPPFAGGRADH